MKTLKTKIRKWISDFNKTQPTNLGIDTDTFEGSAYYLLTDCHLQLNRMEKYIKYVTDYPLTHDIGSYPACYDEWLENDYIGSYPACYDEWLENDYKGL